LESNWRLNVAKVGLSDWGLSTANYKTKWLLVARLITPYYQSGFLYTHLGLYYNQGPRLIYGISLSSSGTAMVFDGIQNSGYPWPAAYGPVYPD